MRKRAFTMILGVIFVVEITVLVFVLRQDTDAAQDAVLVNEAVQSVQRGWDGITGYEDRTGLRYAVLDRKGRILFKTDPGVSEDQNAAVIHRDTMLDIRVDGQVVGKIIFYNESGQIFKIWKQKILFILAAALAIQWGICVLYSSYLDRTVIGPFHRLQRFAERVAGGDLDVPLGMDRQNLFGPFTESFDIMRAELKKARLAEAKANADKKELVAKLSHDIKTPIASIKAASEVGAALAESQRTREGYIQITRKADQINTLVTDLFTAALEELQQLPVTPEDMASGVLRGILTDSDHLHRAQIPDIPECLLYADRLRLQQVFDNIFANAYKYAGITGQKTEMGESGKNGRIEVIVCRRGAYLSVSIEDYGGGVKEEELPFLKEKFRRGSNQTGVEGAGLGLYISDYFMREMKGELAAANGSHGLVVTVSIPLSGGSGGTI